MVDRAAAVSRWHDEDGEICIVDSDGIRYLYFSNDIIQSAVDLNEPQRLVLSYTKAMIAGLLFADPSPKHALLIGLGGGALVHFLKYHFPALKITVAEKRASLIDMARSYFMLDDLKDVEYISEDGASFLRQDNSAYDLILVDAFDDNGLSPQVCNGSFLSACYARLSFNGVVITNLWRSQELATEEVVSEAVQIFEGRALVLGLQDKGNLILFAGRSIPTNLKLRSLRERAKQLEKSWNVDLRRLLKLVKPPAATSWIKRMLNAVRKN